MQQQDWKRLSPQARPLAEVQECAVAAPVSEPRELAEY
jgi:hypothetical protein